MGEIMRNIFFKSFPVIVVALISVSCVSTSKKSLLELVRQGRYDEAKDIFTPGADINETDADGNTALHIAAKDNAVDIVSFLVIKGADTGIKNNAGDTALHVAINNDALDTTKVLATVRSDVFLKNAAEVTALEMALKKDDLWYDAVITPQTGSIRDIDGQSIVHYFVKARNGKAVDCCVRQQLPLSVKDKKDITPLALAYQSVQDPASIQIAAKLILGGSDLVGGRYQYFEQAVKNHNMLMRFEDGQTPLHIAAIQGDFGIADYIVNDKITLSQSNCLAAQDISGATPLHEAVRYGRTNIVRLLLEKGANVNAMDALGKPPILLIIPPASQKDIYATLVQYGADIRQKDTYGDSVLHVATMSRVEIDILQFLVANGANVNERNKQGISPVSLAIENNLPSHVQFYSENGVDIYAQDMERKSPLVRALRHKSPDVLRVLVTKRNIFSTDSAGNTPLHTALLINTPIEYTKYIIAVGADVNALNKNGDSALFLAAQRNKAAEGSLLIEKGADIFVTNRQNNSPLRIALADGSPIMDWLITSSTLNRLDGTGNTPLHYAAEWDFDAATLTLIKKGARINAENANGETPLFLAVKADCPTLIKTLIDNGAVYDPVSSLARDNRGNALLHASVRWNATKAAEMLISLGIDINAQNMDGKTALSDACRANKLPMAIFLMRNGADVNATDATGRTVLMDAVQGRYLDTIKLLLGNGANPQIQDMYGRSAYHEAALTGDIQVINLIRNVGGKPLARDMNGETPFSLALRHNFDVIRAVLGNDTGIVDSDGNTPIHIGVEKKVSRELLKRLLDLGYPASLRNGSGMTALNIAVTQNSKSLSQVLLEYDADPFLATKDGENALTSVFRTKNTQILDEIVKYNKTNTDKQGDTILHYAARGADEETVRHLLGLGLNKDVRNISGETPAQMAFRWNRPAIAALLQGKQDKK